MNDTNAKPDKRDDSALIADMNSRGIDEQLSFRILERFNAGEFDDQRPVEVQNLPGVDGVSVIDTTGSNSLEISTDAAAERLHELGVDPARVIGSLSAGSNAGLSAGNASDTLQLDHESLRRVGMHLLPYTAYGVLNGGSATSYADEKKNRGLSDSLFEIYKPYLDRYAPMVRGKAKGLTPAFFKKDGSPGPSFLELKMRHVLLLLREWSAVTGETIPAGHTPMFQMTSVNNDEEVERAYKEYRESPLLADLIERTGVDITSVRTGVQPMISAYTHSEEGRPKRVFSRAFAEAGRTLPLPGGHGQSFAVLSETYRSLRRDGFRFAYIGNVDNLGYTIDPVTLAYFALTRKPAAFEFAFRTPVDVKGGILVEDVSGRLTCGDIGPAVSREAVFEAEQAGTAILFNCATGLFDLDVLISDLDRIQRDLPVRFSDQNKDAGRYSQAEQVTWEVIGMLEDPLIFGVDKYKRFLAAKLLSENLMTSGIEIEDPAFPSDESPERDLSGTAANLHRGLSRLLNGVYGLPDAE